MSLKTYLKNMIKIFDNIKLNINCGEDELLKISEKKLAGKVKYFKILKKSLDARDKNNINWLYSVAVSTENELQTERKLEKIKRPTKVVVIGSGPAGLFCALRLVEHGFMPIIIERGECVEERRASLDRFFKERKLNTESNVQFGEGGAGAFSDGKLNTQTKDGLNKDVLNLFHKFGATDDILYLNKPHIGSDILFTVLQNIRKYISDNGGEYRFNSKFIDFTTQNGKIKSVIIQNTKTASTDKILCDDAVLALGHSARDTFEMLHKKGISMEAREFSIGVRVEHLAKNISFAQYGKSYPLLPTADYKLVSHAHERTVFTFCMCPGGVVIPSASEEGGVVTNGMSLYKRDGENSNSALMVQLKKSDFGEGLFDGMNFQREIEKRAFVLGGGNYSAPVQLVGDFLKDRDSQRFLGVKPTYQIGTNFVPLKELLPQVAVDALRAAIPDMNRRLKGFSADDGILTGVESRFTSPLKILRTATGESVSLLGLYPCGEGSGYSGGITSSAADGLSVAEKIFEKTKNNI